jgi:hypothetical protein
MNRRYTGFAVVFAVSILIGLQVVEVAEANPVPWLSTPNREKPILTLQAPTNQTTYKTEVPIDFTVTAPESWATYTVRLTWNHYYVGEVQYIAVYLDSNLLIKYTTGSITSYFYGNKTIYPIRGFDGESTHYLFNLNQTTSGSHTLNVTVFSFTYADGDPIDDTAIAFQTGTINGEPIYAYKYPNVVSEVIHFTVEQPTPTQSIPTINTGSTLQVELNPAIPYIILAVVIVIAAIASVLLVFFKRHKPKPLSRGV